MAHEHTAEARRLVAKTLSEMRELSQLLCPPVLTLYGLVPSLDAHMKAFVERHRIAASFSAEGIAERLPAEMEIAIYRITQEALTNVVRHAQARNVRVTLRAERDGIRLEVQDDGVGIRATRGQGASPGTGIIGMTERVRALGGVLRFAARGGTCLEVTLPFPAEARAAAEPAAVEHPLREIEPAAHRLDPLGATGGA